MKRAVLLIAVAAIASFVFGRCAPVGLPDQRIPTTITESTEP